MCGIAGFLGEFDPKLLNEMEPVISHRGPDDVGIEYISESGLGLIHRRLSIIDLSNLGHQPMWDTTHTVCIVFNGEIFNYKELREELLEAGHPFYSHSDTEVLLQLYLRDGKSMLSHLNGMYAFALWDTRNSTLFVARDGVGVKPMYYAETPQGFLFASEMKALLKIPQLDRSLNLEAIHYYLTYLWCPAPHTVLSNVQKLEPGHALLVHQGTIQNHWQFYELPYDQPVAKLSETDAVEQTQFYIKQAVERQMIADVPVGAFLSGGLDSSSIVAFAQKHRPQQRMQCYTIGFKDDSFQQEGMADDLPYAKQVAQHLDVDLHTVEVGSDMVDELKTMLYHLDEPQADPAPLNALFICRLANKHGLKVLLSGAGGDDIFTGYRRHYALMQEKYWDWLPSVLRSSLGFAARGFPSSNPWGRRISRAFQYAHHNGDERIASYFHWMDANLQQSLYGPQMRKVVESLPFSSPLVRSLSGLPPTVLPLNRMLYLEGKHFLADHNLNYTDKMSMAAGVEVRVPLLDPDLIAFAARLPLEFKQQGTIGKWIFKKAMEPYLPTGAIYRPKTGFGVPLRHWLRHDLNAIVEDVLSPSSLSNRGLFDVTGVQHLLYLDKQGRVDGTYPLFALMCVELWCRIFLDGTL